MQKEQNQKNTDTIQRNITQKKFWHEVYTYYAKSVQQNSRGKNFCVYYESLLNVRDSPTE
jgi:hypothetical protein